MQRSLKAFSAKIAFDRQVLPMLEQRYQKESSAKSDKVPSLLQAMCKV
jgi:hypothetical protein